MNDFPKTPARRRTVLRGLALAAAGTALPVTATTTAAAATSAPPAADTAALTLVHLGRDGRPATAWTTRLSPSSARTRAAP
ncbi:hypothetical protein AB6O49_33300 [Streptomyces sp. SBR177]